jgi:hypothetical protein
VLHDFFHTPGRTAALAVLPLPLEAACSCSRTHTQHTSRLCTVEGGCAQLPPGVTFECSTVALSRDRQCHCGRGEHVYLY